MTSVSFNDLGLSQALLTGLTKAGYTTPTPIQAQAIPALLGGRDLLGLAETGTGKTAAFGLPLIDLLNKGDRADPANRPPRGGCRVLILTPTRELALQVEAEIGRFARPLGLSTFSVLGGVGRRPQVLRLAKGVDILVGTPGRVVDLMTTRELKLDRLSHFVLDEADRMLDLGFIADIRRIVKNLPKARHSLLFSATMPDSINKLAQDLLRQPLRVEVAKSGVAPTAIEQSVYFVAKAEKRDRLKSLLDDPSLSRVIVFTRTKHGANKVAEQLDKWGISSDAIHGNKSQGARQAALGRFKSGKARVLVATDIAARGIDVSGITHVVNFDLPNEPESYIHRIGRTARAGAAGIALSFCDAEEVSYLKAIERLTGVKLAIAGGIMPAPANDSRNSNRRNENRGGARRASNGPARHKRPQDERAQGDRREGERSEGRRTEGRTERRTEGRSERRPESGRSERRDADYKLQSAGGARSEANGGDRPAHRADQRPTGPKSAVHSNKDKDRKRARRRFERSSERAA